MFRVARALTRAISRAATPVIAALLIGLCGAVAAGASGAGGGQAVPQRIISVDYCADQFALRFAHRAQIAAVSPHATAPFSYMRAEAAGLPVVRPRAEDLLLERPELVVRAYGGGPTLPAFLDRVGIPVLAIEQATDMAGIMANVERIAAGLGNPAAGRAVVQRMRDRLAALPDATGRSALYITAGGASTGPGTLIHELLASAGLHNFQHEPGWRALPLERLAREQPSLFAAAFFGGPSRDLNRWSGARHPVVREQLAVRDVVPLDGAWTACGGWFLLDAVEALAEGAAR